jgi:hypothetical protein
MLLARVPAPRADAIVAHGVLGAEARSQCAAGPRGFPRPSRGWLERSASVGVRVDSRSQRADRGPYRAFAQPGGYSSWSSDAGLNAKTLKQLDDETWEVNLENTAIRDLGVLAGARISSLSVGRTAVTDLTPLRGLPLTFLVFYGTKVRDLSPLQGMALEKLTFSNTAVADLTPLRGMPLKSLGLSDTLVADLSALRGMPFGEHQAAQVRRHRPLAARRRENDRDHFAPRRCEHRVSPRLSEHRSDQLQWRTKDLHSGPNP